MRRILIILLIFMFAFSTLCISGCRMGDESCNCHGLASNDVINCPLWSTQCGVCAFDCVYRLCGDSFDAMYRDLEKDEFKLESLSVVSQSDGKGSNGYITVNTRFTTTLSYDIFYISYKINVYDNGSLVGSAIVTVNEEEWREKIKTITKGESTTFENTINVQIDTYISGNYQLELEYVEGKVV